MTHSIHPSAKQGFSAAAELYQQVRPNYPEQIVTYLKTNLNLAKQAHLVDLGSGTGKFIPYLKALSPNITAVEPVTEMLVQLQHVHPDVKQQQAMSDALKLEPASVDAVFCAQSFHWFSNIESLKEIHRVLKKDGVLVLVWNQRDVNIDWVKALADLIHPFEQNTPRFHSGTWSKVFKQQSLFEKIDETTFAFCHSGTVEQVVSKRLLSTSFIAAMPISQQQELKQQFEQVVLNYTDKKPQDLIDFPYQTHLYIFRKLDS